jgi:hypothetical protein
MRRSLSDTIGKGVLAGLVGTAAITVAQKLDMKLTGREPSTAPAEAVEKVVGVEPKGDESEERLSTIAHWAYGTGWGVPRAAMGAIGLPSPIATLLHFGMLWGGALVMLPALRIAPPATEMERKDLAKDALLHFVYAAAAGFAYTVMDRRDRKRAA